MVRAGDTWGRIKCLAIIDIWDIYHQDGEDGIPEGVVNDTKYDGYRLLCDCGKELEIKRVDFRGKKYHRDCGCRLAEATGKLIQMCVALPEDIVDLVSEWAHENTNGNRSRAMVLLIRAGKETLKTVLPGRAGNTR